MEMRIAARLVAAHDFSEGVRAVIIDKDGAPHWEPASLEGVTDAMLDAVFAPLPAPEEWSPIASCASPCPSNLSSRARSR
jgi:enoyl-CoA hydratase